MTRAFLARDPVVEVGQAGRTHGRLITLGGALLADWVRWRSRWDLWFGALAAVGLSALFFAGSYLESIGHFGWGGSSFPPPGIDLPAEAAALRAPYAFPQSLVTVLAGTWPIALFAAYAGIATVGSEFAFGTIRTSLTAEPSPVVFLGARLTTLLVLLTALFGFVLALAALLPGLFALLGDRFPPVPAPSPVGLSAEIGARLLAAFGFAALGVFWTVVTRSLTSGTIVTVVQLVLESVLLSRPELNPIPAFTLTGATDEVVRLAHRIAGAVPPVSEVEQIALAPRSVLEPHVSLIVAGAWLVGLIVASIALLERADVTE